MSKMDAPPNVEATIAMMQELGFQVRDSQSHPQAFGSWFVRADASAGEFRVVWDGREKTLAIQEPSLSGKASDWGDRWVAGEGYSHSLDDLKAGLLAIDGGRD